VGKLLLLKQNKNQAQNNLGNIIFWVQINYIYVDICTKTRIYQS